MQDNTEIWKALIVRGNQAFTAQDWATALDLYEQARRHACQDCYSKQPLSRQKLANVQIAYFNLADTYLKLKKTAIARTQYSRCFRFLEEMLLKAGDDADLLDQVISAYSHCRAEWLTFKDQVAAADPPELQRIEHAVHHLQTAH